MAAVCLDAVKAAFPQFGPKSIDRIGKDIDRRIFVKQDAGAGYDEALAAAVKEVGEEINEATALGVQHRQDIIRIHARLMSRVRETTKAIGKPWQAIEAAQVGTNALTPGSRASTSAEVKALERTYMAELFKSLKDKGVYDKFKDEALKRRVAGDKFTPFDREIAYALEKTTNPKARGSTNADANKIAQSMAEVRESARRNERTAGGGVGFLRGYITRVSHNRDAIGRAGYGAWRADVMQHLDPVTTFRGDDPEAFLRSTYDSIMTGVHLTSHAGEDATTVFAFKGPGNLAKRDARHRVLQWKDADGWMAYHEKYGTGSLGENVVGELKRYARNTALLRNWGPNPEAMLDKVLTDTRREYRADPKISKGLAKAERRIRANMEIIQGFADIPDGMRLANVTQTALQVKAMASLGKAGISAVGDAVFRGADARQLGIGFFRGTAGGINDALSGVTMTKAERLEMGLLLRVGIDSTMGDVMARFGSVDYQVPGQMTWLTRQFFRLNGLAFITDSMKRGHARMISADLAQKKDLAFDGLDELSRTWLKRYNITPEQWDAMRTYMVVDAPDGAPGMFPELAKDVPEDVLKRILGDVKFTPERLKRARLELEINLVRFFSDRAEHASPTPGVRERRIMTGNTILRPGTWLGSLLRAAMQFKGFPVAVTTKVIGPVMFNSPLKGGGPDIVGIAQLAAFATAAGYGMLSAKALIEGRTPPMPDDLGDFGKLFVDSFIQGGAGGLYADFLLGEHHSYGRGAFRLAAGPIIGEADTLASIVAAAGRGDLRASQLLRQVWSNVPFQNLAYTKAITDYMILYQLQEAVNPGTIRRMEKTLKRERGQQFFFPPSQGLEQFVP